MKITDKRNSRIEFDNLECGTVFEVNEILYIKIPEIVVEDSDFETDCCDIYGNLNRPYINAYCIGTNEYYYFTEQVVVIPLCDCELIIR